MRYRRKNWSLLISICCVAASVSKSLLLFHCRSQAIAALLRDAALANWLRVYSSTFSISHRKVNTFAANVRVENGQKWFHEALTDLSVIRCILPLFFHWHATCA